MTKYYVSGSGSDSKDGKSEATAWRSLTKSSVLVAGDTLYLMDGVYSSRFTNILNIANKHGSAEAPITFTVYPGHTPVLEAHKNNWNAISITGSSYIVIEGLTLVGARDEITLEYALEQKTNLNNPATSGNGINVTFVNGKPKRRSHHITIRNNNISKFPGGGIATTEVDYITVEGNIVSGNAWYSPYGNQGITMLNLWNSDDNVTDYKVIIKGNTSFDNKQLVPWINAGKITEGHGIMLDTSYIEGVPYAGNVLIGHNILYNNGGAGIQIFKGENPVEIVNNTTYQNSQVLNNGEILLNQAKNVKVSKNIFYCSKGQSINPMFSSSNCLFENNLAFNGAFKGSGGGNIVGQNPLFIDEANKNFSIQDDSPAYLVVSEELGSRQVTKTEEFKTITMQSVGCKTESRKVEQILGYS